MRRLGLGRWFTFPLLISTTLEGYRQFAEKKKRDLGSVSLGRATTSVQADPASTIVNAWIDSARGSTVISSLCVTVCVCVFQTLVGVPTQTAGDAQCSLVQTRISVCSAFFFSLSPRRNPDSQAARLGGRR